MTKKTVVLLHAHFDAEHLADVQAEMVRRGPPTLRAIEAAETIYLLEGCHRARAAAALGIPVVLDLVDYNWERDDDVRLSDRFSDIDCDATFGEVTGRIDDGQYLDVLTND